METMMNITTTYLGLELEHPFVAGAGPLSYHIDTLKQLEDGGASAVVLHSLFEEQITHQQDGIDQYIHDMEDTYAEATSFFPSSFEFRYGPEEYLEHLHSAKEQLKIPVIGSLNGIKEGTWGHYAQLIQQAGADALELNLYSVPTRRDESSGELESRMLRIVTSVREATNLPLAVKLSPYITSLAHFCDALSQSGADAVVLFNRFYQPDINLEELEMEPSLKLSDPSELLLRLRWLSVLRGSCPDLQLSCSGSVHSVEDGIKALMCGADSVQLVSAILQQGPKTIHGLRTALSTWLEEHEYESLGQLKGSMSLRNCPNPEALERANYMKVLQSFR